MLTMHGKLASKLYSVLLVLKTYNKSSKIRVMCMWWVHQTIYYA